ncbi:MAG: DNA polymerase III subunit gamma/tau [Oscillospiraceae bacterium]|nr:DNA polymerase III subunit gamma/tau [Oscillospiraceae bacterium]
MYLALYRKYRPKTFSDVISQPHITITLQNQLNSGQVGHAYLFTGSRGTGKTTCAKILAKAVNCLGVEKAGEHSSPLQPCLICEACLTADNSPDISEIDAASNNGVDDIRALRSEVGYLPTELKYKVYIIDEVHMLSASAFNALLKTLEEPPPHVIFILATTESHKIPATVLSRCQRFEFNRINMDESADMLIKVAEKEGITLERDAALLISRLSDGGMRDALSLLDVAASENKTITQDIIRNCAGIAGKEHLFAITNAIANGDGKAALTVTAELYAKSKDPSRLIDELIGHFRNLMIVKIMPSDTSLLTALPNEVPDYINQAGLFTLERIIKSLDTLEECLKLRGRKIEAEICLMRLCIDSEQFTVDSVQLPEPKPVPLPVVTETAPPKAVPLPEPQEIVPLPEPPPVKLSEPGEVFSEWQSVLDKLGAYQASLLEEAVAEFSGDTITITGGIALQSAFEHADNIAPLLKAIRDVTGKDYKIVFEQVGGDDPVEPLPITQFLNNAKNLGIEVKEI